MTSINQKEQSTSTYLLDENLTNIQHLRNQFVVIKFGGNAMSNTMLQSFAHELVSLQLVGIKPLVVHGGGPQINAMLKALHVPSQFVCGLRVTTPKVAEVVEMVLCGQVNPSIVGHIHQQGGKAVGINGRDGQLFCAKRLQGKDANNNAIDIGQVGEINQVNPQLLHTLYKDNYLPVIAPISADNNGSLLNINADSAAGALAASVQASTLILLTNTKGVCNQQGDCIRKLNRNSVDALKKAGVIVGGMVPKIDCALHAIDAGVRTVCIVDGTKPYASLQVLCGKTAGTEITA